MLRSLTDMQDYAIGATDGNIGHVKDFYFDDKAWVIRYLVVDTGAWLSGRKVLISPIAIGHPNWLEKSLPVAITMEQVKNSPDIETDKPVSRQHEIRYHRYYDFPHYWDGTGLWGAASYPYMMMPQYPGAVSAPRALQQEAEQSFARAEAVRHQDDDPHLRSCMAVMRYDIEASDGSIGHVQGMLVDEETWAVRYMVVDTSSWWLGRQVLIAPQWIRDISWSDAKVSLNLTCDAVKRAPPYDTTAHLNREQEIGIYQHYGLPGYWTAEPNRVSAVSLP